MTMRRKMTKISHFIYYFGIFICLTNSVIIGFIFTCFLTNHIELQFDLFLDKAIVFKICKGILRLL